MRASQRTGVRDASRRASLLRSKQPRQRDGSQTEPSQSNHGIAAVKHAEILLEES